MNNLTTLETRLPAIFKPEEAKINDAKADAIIAFAARVKDWPSLEIAIDAKIENQIEFVRWWSQTVKSAGNPAKKSHELICADQRKLSFEEAETLTGIKHQQESKWRKRTCREKRRGRKKVTETDDQNIEFDDQKIEHYRKTLYSAAYRRAMAGDLEQAAFMAYAKGEEEWYTPANIIEMARRTMGGIDTDPASSEIAQKTVKASQFYSVRDDGLTKDWHGRVWMNPPYRQPLVRKFVDKLVSSFEHPDGPTTEGIMLVNNCADTEWFRLAASRSSSMCFPYSRVRFLDKDGNPGAPLQGQTIFYFGLNRDKFKAEFNELGYFLAWDQ